MRRVVLSLMLSSVMCSTTATAAMKTTPVDWQVGGQAFSGVLVYDDSEGERRPGIVMVPNWMGVTDAAIAKAKDIAGDDYVVLVADMFGKGVRPKDADEALALVRPLYGAPEQMRARVVAALDALRSAKGVPLQDSKIAGVGFCFGGSSVLELARTGADVAGVVSLHGGLKTGLPVSEAGTVKAPILVLNGAADTAVPQDDITGFAKEMDVAGADWQFVNFSGARHCFAEEEAARPPNCVYDKRSAQRAYRMMDDFLDEAFGDD